MQNTADELFYYCLSVLRPWSMALAMGIKKIETRGWSTSHRGKLLIHSGQGLKGQAFDHEITRPCFKPLLDEYGNRLAAEALMPAGFIVAVADLVDCAPCDSMRILDIIGPNEWELGDHSDGRFGWVLDNVVQFPRPIKHRGQQRLFRVPASILTAAGVTV